ncbi:hypothetical protein GCM10009789_68220 [Kribbella sancticallisti]|uniref:Uncharacterized protein n=1 Tax=Kribbella sancticallisti TaxID=460087 RepID=A0ABP4Q9E1_9ACTN
MAGLGGECSRGGRDGEQCRGRDREDAKEFHWAVLLWTVLAMGGARVSRKLLLASIVDQGAVQRFSLEISGTGEGMP